MIGQALERQSHLMNVFMHKACDWLNLSSRDLIITHQKTFLDENRRQLLIREIVQMHEMQVNDIELELLQKSMGQE
jgi:hypothetical protein